MSVSDPSAPRLKHFPVTFFAMVMGLTGLSLAWRKAEIALKIDLALSDAILVTAIAAFLVVGGAYLAKLMRYPDAVRKELGHPIQLNFFPALSISLILLATAVLHLTPGLAHLVWAIGTLMHLGFTLYVLNVWFHHDHFEIQHINPAWFIPVVGNVLVPIAGVALGYRELSWFFFSIGILFWLVLFAIILYRVLFHHPLPDRLMPTFFIMIAPPAVGFIAYAQLTDMLQAGAPDAFARMLYYSGLFLTLLLATQVRRFARLEFFLSWWAYAFPLAAISLATLVMYDLTGLPTFAAIGWVLLSIVTVVVIYLLYRTAKAASSRTICVPPA